MLDTSYKHFDINSKFKIPKKYGSVQNMSFRELQKWSKKIQRNFCNVRRSQTIKKNTPNERQDQIQ